MTSKRSIKLILSVSTSYHASIISAVAVMTFGLSVMIGWYGHIESLIRYEPGTVAMVYNTALCFVLSGMAILALTYQFRISGLIIGTLILVIAVASLTQHLFSIDLGIDQLLFKHYDTLENKFAGRMAPNTALCFILSSLGLSSIGTKNCNHCVIFSTMLGMLIFFLSVVFISGYLNDLQTYMWGSVTPISITASIGFVLLSSSMMLTSWHMALKRGLKLTKLMPFVSGLCIFIATCVLAIETGDHELLNNYSSNIPLIIFIVGTLLSILFGLLLQATHMALSSSSNAKQSLSLMQATLESTADGILVLNLDGEIVAYNTKFCEMWNLMPSKMSRYNRQTLSNEILEHISNKEKYFSNRRELSLHPFEENIDELRLKNGNIIERHVKPQVLDNELIGRVCSYRDITKQKKLEARLLHENTYDTLTGLPNRALLIDLIERSLSVAEQNKSIVGIFLIDIDKFSHINDLVGRIKGEEFLKAIAERVKNALNNEYILGRIGGDQFIVVSNNMKKVENASLIIEKLMLCMKEPFQLYNHKLNISLCIGAAFYPKDGGDTDALLRNTDTAILRAKKEGRGQFQFYSEEMNDYTTQKIELENKLRQALQEDQLIIYYQPIFDLRQNELIAIEALVRWQHPQMGLVLPLDFIPLAEEIGLIPNIGKWVLTNACKQVKQWHDAGYKKIKVAVNVSAPQFKYGSLSKTVIEALEHTGLDPKYLELEITESILIGNFEEVSHTLQQLTALGVTIAIDDFGTGYSSFSYVKTFPISKLKIDRIFISSSLKSEEDKAIVKAIISMGKSLNFIVLAEGIEDNEQLAMLNNLGCEQGQGYYFSRPLPAAECANFIKKYHNF